MRRVGTRSLIIIGVIIFYFLILRPIRAEFNRVIYRPIIEISVSQNDNLSFNEGSSTVGNVLTWNDGTASHELAFSVPLGLQFLLGVIGLVLIGGQKSFYFYLVAIQLIGNFLAVTFLFAGHLAIIQLLVISDLLLRYLIPLCSLGMVPLAFIYQKKIIDEG